MSVSKRVKSLPVSALGAKKRAHVSAADFVKAVMQSVADGSGYAGISEKTGMQQTSVATRISTLRKKGVKIPNMPRSGGGGGRKLDIDALNSLINS